MKAVLLLASPTRDSPLACAYAIERARALGAELVVAAVLDPAVGDRVSRKLDERAFVGEKVTESVVCCLERDLRIQGEELVQAIAAQARAAGVGVTTRIEEGELSDVAGRCCGGREIAVVVVAAEKRSWVGRLFAADADVQRRLRLPHCEIKVIEG